MEFIKKYYIFFIIIILIVIIILLLVSSKKKEKTYSDLTIVGDSRMVGLCAYSWYQEDNGTCIAEVGMGYYWLIETAIPRVNVLDTSKKKNIAVNLGVNDIYNLNNYIKKYKELAEGDWKDSNIYIVSVNPTKGSYDNLNKDIDNFNEKMKNSFEGYANIKYCDTNKLLKETGFETSDGLHYNNSTSKKIYEEIKRCIYN